MSMSVPAFEFVSAGRIVFGRGEALRRVPKAAKELGATSVLIVVGSSPTRAQPFADALQALGIATCFFSIGGAGEPTLDTAEAGLAAAKACNADLVISIGGGSAVDTGKAIAALRTQPEGLLAYMEVVGQGKPLVNRPVPFIAVPTTAGTGAEVTKNSVFDSPQANVKASIRSDWMVPTLAVVDPELTLGVPADVTAATGLDALTQCLEPYVCCAPNPMTDCLALEGLRRAARSLRRAYVDGGDVGAREDMCVASLFGGLSLANAKLGAVHGFAGPLGGMLHGPHGALCAAMLPAAMAVNVEALQAGGPACEPALQRFHTVAQVLTGRADATAQDGVTWIRDICAELRIPGLKAYGMTAERVPEAILKAGKSSSMKGNPVALSEQQMARILTLSM